MKDIIILAIESSCDETAASVVKNGRDVLSNVISSQIALHTLYGGVVPEIASRKHIEKINQVIEEALAEAKVTERTFCLSQYLRARITSFSVRLSLSAMSLREISLKPRHLRR